MYEDFVVNFSDEEDINWLQDLKVRKVWKKWKKRY
jgi:site-specific recombinase